MSTFSDLVISIQRSVYHGIIGKCKTETSRKPMPLDERVAADLWLWKETTRHCNAEDWIFASPHKSGKDPYWPGTVLAKIIQPAAVRAGICKKVGWHTFRHTYSTLWLGMARTSKWCRNSCAMRKPGRRWTFTRRPDWSRSGRLKNGSLNASSLRALNRCHQ